jgi:hypothetical protein
MRQRRPPPVPRRLAKTPDAGHPLPSERVKMRSLLDGNRRLPTFEIPSGAPIIPASRIERVVDEEGLF